MHQVVFQCDCGMTLKVDANQVDQAPLICPSCQARVKVPAFVHRPPTGRDNPAPPAEDHEEDEEHEEDEASHPGTSVITVVCAFGMVAATAVATVFFLVIPALERARPRPPVAAPAVVARTDATPASRGPSSGARSKRLRVAPPPDEPEKPEEAEKPAESEKPEEPILTTPSPAPGPPEPDPGPPATPKARPRLLPPRALGKSATPRGLAPSRPEAAKPEAGKSEYAHIKNESARRALEFASLNARRAASAGAAGAFLKQARRAAGDDPEVIREIEKIEARIKAARSRDP